MTQHDEIKTIKPRKIILNLSDADAERITNKAAACGLTVGELLENFIGDLVGGTYSNGSDERAHAGAWFDRCGFSWLYNQTFTTYALNNWIMESVTEAITNIEDTKADIIYTTENIKRLEADAAADPDEIADEKEELNALQEDLKAFNDELSELYDEYAKACKDENPEPLEKAVAGVMEYIKSLEELRDGNGAE